MVRNVNKYVGRTFGAASFTRGGKRVRSAANYINCRASPPVNNVKIKKLTYNR